MPVLWVFEDQLSPRLPTLALAPAAPVLLIESATAFAMWPYHPKRLTFLISAMRHFAAELSRAGRAVHHYPLRPTGYRDSLSALRDVLRSTGEREFWVVEPSEWHTRQWLDTLPAALGLRICFFPNTLFLTDRAEFKAWTKTVRSPVMELFYRAGACAAPRADGRRRPGRRRMEPRQAQPQAAQTGDRRADGQSL